MRAYGTKNSDSQIKNLPIRTDSQFAKFNACQNFQLYSISYVLYMCTHLHTQTTFIRHAAKQLGAKKLNSFRYAAVATEFLLNNCYSPRNYSTKFKIFLIYC